MQKFYVSGAVFALFGVLDALLWLWQGETLYGQLFSLAELSWLALSLFALVVAWQQGLSRWPVLTFVFYQGVLWSIGVILAQQARAQGLDFVPPDAMLAASLLFYGGYFVLCRHYYSVQK